VAKRDVQRIALVATRCAICGTHDNSETVYPSSFDAGAFTPAVFSARRTPDQTHYRIVRCLDCGLLRSDPVATDDVLSDLYARSEFHYAEETANLARTYGRYLSKLDRFARRKEALLEVGCGNGFFLEEAGRLGYRDVGGVEPSLDAVSQAPQQLRDSIVVDIMRPGLFDEQSFDVVCLFQVLDHLADPAAVLSECLTLLRPGGLLLCLNHDAAALSARVLGARSPIIDIEHTYLYNQETIARLTADQGYQVLESGTVWNTYSMRYLAHLLPLPGKTKSSFARALKATRLESLRLSVKLGNLYVIAERPEAPR
jgi:SAM-dependent methyltransferase